MSDFREPPPELELPEMLVRAERDSHELRREVRVLALAGIVRKCIDRHAQHDDYPPAA